MIESILSLICWVWLPALLVLLHHSVWRQQSRLLWMNWVSARGLEMALIPLWCHSGDKEKRGSFMRPPVHSSVLSHCASPPVLYFCDGFILQPAGYLSPHHPHPQPVRQLSPTRDAFLADFPCPALPCPALLVPAPVDSGPSREKKNPNFTLTLWHTGKEGC